MPVSTPADGPRHRFVLWLAHHAAWWWVAVGVLFALGVLTHDVPGISHILFVVVVVATIVMTHVEIRHARVLCPRCAAAVPLDAARKAADRAATLHWTYRLCSGYSRWRFTADIALAAVIGAVVLLPVPLLIASIVGVVAFGVRPVDAHLIRVHDPLQPWCPHCHWDNGDDGEDTDVPDPMPPSGAGARS